MEATRGRNVNTIRCLLLILALYFVDARIHELTLKDDDRKTITVSTFGFLTGGTLAVNVSLDVPKDIMKAHGNVTLFGFTLDKTTSPGLSGYIEDMQKKCILNDLSKENKDRHDEVESVYMRFDLPKSRLNFERLGSGVQKLLISTQSLDKFRTAFRLHRRDAGTAVGDGHSLGYRRRVRAAVSNDTPDKTKASTAAPASRDDSHVSPDDSPQATAVQTPPDASGKTPPNGSKLPHGGTQTSNQDNVAHTEQNNTASSSSSSAENSKGGQKSGSDDDESGSSALLTSADVSVIDGVYHVYFLVYIQRPEEEGLYNLYFHNCLAYPPLNAQVDDPSISLSLKIVEDNNGNYLTAGEMPVPALYFTFCVLFFIIGVAWFSVLRKSKDDVFKIHYLMLVVIFVKSLACLFHGVNMYFIQINGVHEEAWAILWYIVYLTRGALMFVTVLLIGAGWAFIKHMLTDKEKKLFLIVIPLQVLDQVAWVIVEESEEGNQSYTTWNEIFILVDLLCCGAILFPVVWSIRHLQEASRTDGKAALNLQKLRLFRHFYIMVVVYIYFTRIIVYLMRITLPFKLEWLTDLFKELAMLIFFIVTGIKFRPATDNPYLQVPMDSDDEEIEMEEVLTKTGATENVVRVNQKTEGADNNRVKQRESSHEYD